MKTPLGRSLLGLYLGLALFCGTLSAGDGPAPGLSGGDGEALVKILPNGLTIVVKRNRTAPVAAVRAYVKNTGRIWEGRYCGCGIAHNVEHLVSGGTTAKRTEDESRDLLKSMGADTNAYTHLHHTCYFINTAAASFDTALDLLSDWIMNCAFDSKEVARERETITEEITRAADDWTRAGHLLFYSALFPDHPINVPTLGHLHLFHSLTRDDLVAYHRERYIPQNVVFVVVGDLDPVETLGKVSKAFGDWAMGRTQPLTLPPTSPPTGLKWVEDSHPAAQTCLTYLGWHTIPLNHPDLHALDVLALVLGNGRASRISSRVVEKDRLAAQAGAYSLTPSYGCGLFTGYVLGMPYENVHPAVDAILEEIERTKTEPVGAEELERAKTQCIASHVFGRQTCEDQAEDLGYNVMGVHDARFSEKYIERIRKVTAEEVMDAAKRYLDRDRLTVAVMRPPASGAKPGETEKTGTGTEGAVIKMTLENGLRVLVQRNTSSPIVTLQAWCRAGLGAEPEGLNGINNLCASLLTQGTATRTQMDIHGALEGAGAKIEASGGNNTFGVKIDVLKENLAGTFEIFADILKNPSFPEKEVEKVKFRTLQQIMRDKAEAEEELIRTYRRHYFREHPYRLIQEGTPETIRSITPADLNAYFKRWFVPTNVVIAVAGDLKVEEAKALVEKHFAGLARPQSFEPVPVVVEAPREKAETVKVPSSFKNVLLVAGFPAPGMEDEDRFAMSIFNLIVSGGEGNRIFEALRGGEEGLVYSAWGSFWAGLGASTYYVAAQTSPSKADRVIEIIHSELDKARSDITAKELEYAKRACVVGELIYQQTLSGQAQWAALCELYGMGYDFPKTYLGRIEKVTLEDLKRVAEKYLKNPFVLKLVPKPEGEEGGDK